MSESSSLPVPAGEIKPEPVTARVQQYTPSPNDKVTIAPNVLLTMIRMSALQVPGVAYMGNTPGGVNAWFRRTPTERGVQVLIDSDTVSIDLYIVADAEANLHHVSRQVQQRVARIVEENVGMLVGSVNVHIEDVVFPTTGE